MLNIRNQKMDLSHVNSLEDIDHEIRLIKRRVKGHETDIKEGFKQIPKEALKASLGSVSPLFAKARVADKTFSTIQTLVGGLVAAFIEGKKNGGGFKKGLATTLRQLSFFGTAKTIIEFFSKKKSNGKKTGGYPS